MVMTLNMAGQLDETKEEKICSRAANRSSTQKGSTDRNSI